MSYFAILLLFAFSCPLFSQGSEGRFDIVIKGGRVVDGTGNPWVYADVGIKDGRITHVGQIDPSEGGQVIDAKGKVVSPGFIDVHGHVEGGLDAIPTADNFVRMGVTSVITGNCGGSRPQIESYLSSLKEKGISLNLGTLIGHNTVRRAVMGMEAREPTADELERMKGLVQQAMLDGAVGFSTGLIYEPGSYAKTAEVVELARVAGRLGGIYASHIRNEGNHVQEAIQEAITIGEQAGCPVEISHFKVSSKKRWGDSKLTVKMVSEARRRGQQVAVDQYVYPASSTSLATQLPDWVFEGGNEKTLERLKDPKTRERTKKEMISSVKQSGFKDYSYAFVAGYGPDPTFNGMNIAQITKKVRGKSGIKDQADQIIEMMIAGGAGMVYHRMSEQDIETILRQPFTMIASDSGVQRFNSGVPHPRGYGNNVRVLARYVREKGVISLEDAVRKMTSLPAQTFLLWDRGLIRSGFAADVVVFDEQKVMDLATFEKPHQYAEGIEWVIVHGQVVVANGQHTGAKPGQVLYGPGKSN